VIAIAHALRHKGPEGEEKRKREYRELLQLTRQILADTRRVMKEVDGLSRHRRNSVRGLCEHLQTMADRVRRVVRQTKVRIFGGLTKSTEKIVSLFEPHTEIIRKGKAGKPNEFGKLVQLQEVENQIITHYEVYEERLADQRLLIPAVETHISANWAAYQDWSPRTPVIIHEPTKMRRKKWAWTMYRFRIEAREAKSGASSRSGHGSRTDKNGGRDVRAELAP
jgi:hypothetical protein